MNLYLAENPTSLGVLDYEIVGQGIERITTALPIDIQSYTGSYVLEVKRGRGSSKQDLFIVTFGAIVTELAFMNVFMTGNTFTLSYTQMILEYNQRF